MTVRLPKYPDWAYEAEAITSVARELTSNSVFFIDPPNR